MNIGGTSLVNQIQKPDDSGVLLRLNQRFAAEVLQVSGEQITLSVQGVRVVAKLTSSDQAASLVERRIAQFLVKDLGGSSITLQLIKPGQTGLASGSGGSQVAPELVQRMLLKAGLPLTDENLKIARAMLQNGLAVTAETVEELTTVLQGLGAWGAQSAQDAAMLKAAGLPLTSGSLSLAEWSQSDLTETLIALKDQLSSLVRGTTNAEIKQIGHNALAFLENLIVEWKASGTDMAGQLKRVIGLLSTSLEHEIGQMIQNGEKETTSTRLQNSLMAMIELRQELVKVGNQRLVEVIDRFLETTRWMQFTNVEPQDTPVRGQWLKMDLPLQLPVDLQGGPAARYQEARLRIAYETNQEKSQIDPGYTRLVIRVDLNPGDALDIDLSLVGKQVGAQITSSTQELNALAEEEVGNFEQGLADLGYHLKSARCHVDNSMHSEETEKKPGYVSVNVEA